MAEIPRGKQDFSDRASNKWHHAAQSEDDIRTKSDVTIPDL